MLIEMLRKVCLLCFPSILSKSMVVLNNVLTYILEKIQRKMPQLSIFFPSLLLLGWSPPGDCIYDRFHPAETSSYTSRSLRPEKNGMEGLIQRCAARRTQWQKYKRNRIPVTSTKSLGGC